MDLWDLVLDLIGKGGPSSLCPLGFWINPILSLLCFLWWIFVLILMHLIATFRRALWSDSCASSFVPNPLESRAHQNWSSWVFEKTPIPFDLPHNSQDSLIFCKHLGPQGMFRWLMTTIIVTNEFVQLNSSLSLIWSYVKRGPSISVIQKGDLGIQLIYMSRLRIFLVLSVIRLRRTLRLVYVL